MATKRDVRKKRDKRERGSRYPDDDASRDTPRAERRTDRYTDSSSVSARQQSDYKDSYSTLDAGFDNLSVDPQDARPHYTTDRYYNSVTDSTSSYPSQTDYTVPQQSTAITASTTYSSTGYEPSYDRRETSRERAVYTSSDARGTARSEYASGPSTYSTSPPARDSRYPAGAYSTSPQAATYAYSAVTQSSSHPPASSAYPTGAYSTSPENHRDHVPYEHPSPQQVQQPLAQYASPRIADSTAYSVAPAYIQEGTGYAATQFPPTAQTYNQTTSYMQSTPAYPDTETRNPILPVKIAQCGCLGCDRDNIPKLKDGTSSKKGESSRKRESSKASFVVQVCCIAGTINTTGDKPANVSSQGGFWK
jgi:hypothetical protein